MGKLLSEDKTENLGMVQFTVAQTIIWMGKWPQLTPKCPILEIKHLKTKSTKIYFQISGGTNESISANKVQIDQTDGLLPGQSGQSG